jgi:hypothetical protein
VIALTIKDIMSSVVLEYILFLLFAFVSSSQPPPPPTLSVLHSHMNLIQDVMSYRASYLANLLSALTL